MHETNATTAYEKSRGAGPDHLARRDRREPTRRASSANRQSGRRHGAKKRCASPRRRRGLLGLDLGLHLGTDRVEVVLGLVEQRGRRAVGDAAPARPASAATPASRASRPRRPAGARTSGSRRDSATARRARGRGRTCARCRRWRTCGSRSACTRAASASARAYGADACDAGRTSGADGVARAGDRRRGAGRRLAGDLGGVRSRRQEALDRARRRRRRRRRRRWRPGRARRRTTAWPSRPAADERSGIAPLLDEAEDAAEARPRRSRARRPAGRRPPVRRPTCTGW